MEILPSHLFRLAVLFLLCLPSSVFAQGQDTRDSVELLFAWPESLHGVVTFSSRREENGQGGYRTVATDGIYEFKVSPIQAGLRIDTLDMDVRVVVAPRSSGLEEKLEKFLAQVTSTAPSYIIDGEGNFLRAVEMEVFRSAASALLDELLEGISAESKAKISHVANALLSEQHLEAGTAESWNAIVGFWAGTELQVGDLNKVTYTQPIPLLGNSEIPMKTVYRLVDWVPCDTKDNEARCVDLESRTFPDPQKLSNALTAVVEQMSTMVGDLLVLESLTMEVIIRLITEPRTLIPHRLEIARSSSVVMTMHGERRGTDQIEGELYVFRY